MFPLKVLNVSNRRSQTITKAELLYWGSAYLNSKQTPIASSNLWYTFSVSSLIQKLRNASCLGSLTFQPFGLCWRAFTYQNLNTLFLISHALFCIYEFLLYPIKARFQTPTRGACNNSNLLVFGLHWKNENF